MMVGGKTATAVVEMEVIYFISLQSAAKRFLLAFPAARSAAAAPSAAFFSRSEKNGKG